MRFRRLVSPAIAISAFIGFSCIQDGSTTMILGSMLMAANTAMLMGKLSLGGLMMMMLSQQNGGGLSGIATTLSNLGAAGRKRSTDTQQSLSISQPSLTSSILGLGSGLSAATNSKRTTRSNVPKPKGAGKTTTSAPPFTSTRYFGGGRGQDHTYRYIAQQPMAVAVPIPPVASSQSHQSLHQQYNRYRRNVPETDPQLVNSTTSEVGVNNDTSSVPNPSVETSPSSSPDEAAEIPEAEQLLTYRRLMRQADSFDYMSCLPKFVCGLEAQPPSKKTSILNDYSHLLKLFFGPDDDDDENDDELDDDIELPSDEIDPEKYSDDEYRKLLEQKELLDDAVGEHLLEENPSMLKYVLRDVANKAKTALLGPSKKDDKKSKTKSKISQNGKGKDDKPDSDGSSSSSKRRKTASNAFKKSKYGFTNGKPPPGFFYPSMYPPPGYHNDEPSSSGGFLSKLLPKVEVGFGTKSSEDPDFNSDPFFSGFKRSLDMGTDNQINVNEAVGNGEDGIEAVKRSKRISEPSLRRRRREAVAELVEKDPVINKYKEAQEIGRQSRQRGNKGRECQTTFKKCPYEWNQIMGMISNMRNSIIPSNQTKSGQDKIVVLQVPSPVVPANPGVITAYTKHGETQMSQDLGNGNIMHITMKLTPKVSGFESVPIVQKEPYPDSDELSVESLEILPYRPPPQNSTIGQEQDIELSEEEKIEQVVKKIQSQTNGTWSQKPKRKYRPSPNVNFAFADDVDIAGVAGATILPAGGSDKEVMLKTSKQNIPAVVKEVVNVKPPKILTEPDFLPKGSEKVRPKTSISNIIRTTTQKPTEPPPSPSPSQTQDLEASSTEHEEVHVKAKPSEEVDIPAAEKRDDTDARSSEEDDDDEYDDYEDLGDDDGDEFLIDDRKNGRRRVSHGHNHNHGGEQRQHGLSQQAHSGHLLPPAYGEESNSKKKKNPIKYFSTRPATQTGHIIARPRPYPLLMSTPPILHDESGDWTPIGEKARSLKIVE